MKKLAAFLKRLKEDRIDVLFLVILCLFFGWTYLNWRIFYTIDLNLRMKDIIWAVLLIIGEIYTFMIFTSFSFISLKHYRRSDINPDKIKDFKYFPSVDVLICTLNESEDILRDTIIGCVNIKYPNKKVYLLDDGNRPEIKKLAEKHGCNYIAREKNIGYKAGNVNNALKYTNGEFIALFDADHIPVSTFLMELMDYFKDDSVAIVQTPQHFFNPDPFQKNLSIDKYVRNEQDFFFRIIEPGLSFYNATIVAGTKLLIRRKYMDQVGGMPEDSITEDINLGIRFQSLGYKVLFHNKPLAAGLAPETFKDYVNQRLRWAKGNLQVYFGKDSGKYFRKLQPTQILLYCGGLLYYFLGVPRIIFLISPILFLLFDIVPVIAVLYQLIIFQFSYFIFKILLFYKISKKYRNVFVTDIYETAIAFFLAGTVFKTLLNPLKFYKHEFVVTNKGVNFEETTSDIKLVIPQIIILILAILAFVKAGINLNNPLLSKESVLINIFWNIYNTIILCFAIKVAVERPELRKHIRIPVKLTTKIQNSNIEVPIRIVNLSKGGALLFSDKEIDNLDLFNAEKKSIIIFQDDQQVEVKFIDKFQDINGVYYRVSFNPGYAVEWHNDLIKIMYTDSLQWG